MRKVAGVGINDADYKVTRCVIGKRVWCPFYVKWKSMIERAYATKYHNERPTYIGVTVCEEWHSFSVFKSWMETQDWKGKELDKDLLFPGNKVYSPDTCLFVSAQVNTFLLDNSSRNGQYPTGVSAYRGRYRAMCGFDRSTAHVGTFDTVEQAEAAYLARKKQLAIELASVQTDQRVANAILQRFQKS